MKKFLFFIVLLVGLCAGGLYYLGHKSQGMTAPGLVSGRLAPCPSSPNCVSSEDGTQDEKVVRPFDVAAWPEISDVIAELGGTVTERQADYIAAEFTSETFKFVDDVEFRRASNAVHVRSGSRVGYSDAGVNAARVAAMRQRLGL